MKKRVSYLKQGRDSKGRFTKKIVMSKPEGTEFNTPYPFTDKMKEKLKKKESWFMKKWRKLFYWIVSCMFLVSCSRYQVVSEVDLHMYHMHNPKNNKVEVILTKEKLEIGKYYRLKSIKQVKVEK